MEDYRASHPTIYWEIGRGACGTIWAKETDDIVIKREDGDEKRSVENDQRMHLRILEDSIQLPIRIPQSVGLIASTDAFWERELPNFSASELPCRAYRIERIPRMPSEVRELLICRYCPDQLKRGVRKHDKNQDCLVRLYLGRRNLRGRRSTFFSLRNYPLHVDQAEDLELDTHEYARGLADTLAHCYWRAGVDANDVEFVLAPNAPTDGTTQASGVVVHSSKHLGEHVLWMLDFDCCRAMTMDEEGVEQAVHAFFRNDPYFPRPSGYTEEDDRLWSTFRTRFLSSSNALLMDRDRDGGARAALPRRLVERIEEKAAQLRKLKDLDREGAVV